MTIVRWDSSRDMATLQQQENLSRLQADTLSRLLEATTAVRRKTSIAPRGCLWSTFTATGTTWC